MRLGYGTVGALPATVRAACEGWLARGGVDQVAAVLPDWSAAAHLPARAFHEVAFGGQGSGTASGHAWAVGAALATAPAGDDPSGAGPVAEATRHYAMPATRTAQEDPDVVRARGCLRRIAVCRRGADLPPP